MGVASAVQTRYAGYSYRERAGRYVWELTQAEIKQIRSASASVAYSTLREQILGMAFEKAELLVVRPSAP